ncbi:nucleic acid binding protein, putative [Trypanosoma vivax Y486]|uniref:Nucleic acid binding protein, putative n=1 Tax=Trypanosoma vivax (strain Y486) TaxID=1055687 RepID=F9WRC9_TRYVY|nr:nucleic acid binding protein, putative [Trypanosoma vivax Y486]|eukprot:CCD20113.1 nucleic acid binding protein, putative [Trypanosoma vivax Y486]
MKNISTDTCKNCLSTGHLRRDCPLIECAACSRLGHFKEDCPHRRKRPRADNDIGICRSCGSSSHAQAKCPERIKSVECFQCHQKGHMMPMCPQTRCFNCGHFGHSSQLCAKKRACFHFSMPGHTSTECTRKDMGRLCYRCKEPGHDMAKCPQSPRCHMCNQTGHLVAQCPEVLCNRCHQKGHMASACKMYPCSTDGGSHSSNDRCHEASAGANAGNCANDIERASASTLEKEPLGSESYDTDYEGRAPSTTVCARAQEAPVPPFVSCGAKREGCVAVVIDGSYFERIIQGRENRNEAHYKRIVDILRYTLEFVGDVFQKNPFAFWFDTDPVAFATHVRRDVPPLHRSNVLLENKLRKQSLVDEMNSGRKLSSVVARLVGRMKQEKGYTKHGPGRVWVQAGCDVAIAACLIELFIHRLFEQVVLLCGDADLYHAVQYCHTQRRSSQALEQSNPIRVCGTSSSISKSYGREQDLSDFLSSILLDSPRHVEGDREIAFPTHTMFI